MSDETIQVTLRHRVYANEDSLFAVFEAERGLARESFRVVGPLLELEEGERAELTGQWVMDRRFGRQFKASAYRRVVPTTRRGVVDYLASKQFKGIGPNLAERIVDTLGEDALEILKDEPGRLRDVPGIGQTKFEAITAQLAKGRPLEGILVFLRGVGLGEAFAARVLKALGPKAPDAIKRNPYQLVEQVEGIGFKRADAIACELGVLPESPARVRAGVAYTLVRELEDGHLFCPFLGLVGRAAELLGVEPERVEAILEEQIARGALIVDVDPNHGDFDAPEGDGRRVYLRHAFAAERDVADALRLLLETKSAIGMPAEAQVIAELRELEATSDVQLDGLQREALAAAIGRKVVVITGGPGTGKTTILRYLIRLLDAHHVPVALAAPTGRAAKRMAQACRREARTLHRLLEYNPHSHGFARGASDPLDEAFVVVDEASMIDAFLMRDLVAAIRPENHLVLIGDVDQLPPVGPGAVLNDLIRCGVVPLVRLETIYRQARHSLLVHNAHLINRGKMPEVPERHGPLSDFYFVERESPHEVLETVRELLLERIPERFELDPASEVQVLTPMYRGALGLDNLNVLVQSLLNADTTGRGQTLDRRPGAVPFRVNDKVMQIRYDYDRGVYNGDIGFVTRVEGAQKSTAGSLSVRFDDRIVDYERTDLDALVLAYAISVHKAQGSEFPAVVLPLHTQHFIMLQRNLLYTAVTRARRLAVIVGSRRALSLAVENNPEGRRRTTLDERMRAGGAGKTRARIRD